MAANALQQATDYIKKGLDQQIWSKGDSLPSLTELALAAQVSRGTMAKAITGLKNTGHISVRQGSRIYAGSRLIDETQSESTSLHAWKNKRRLFEQDILKGIFPLREPLPSVGELQARYGLSYRSIIKMLASLTADRIVVAQKKKFYLHHFEQAHRRSEICLLWEGLSYGSKPRPHREGRIMEAFQRGSSLMECTPFFLGFDIDDPLLRDAVRRRLQGHTGILGFIVRPLAQITQERKAKYIELLIELAREKKPVALMDEFGEFILPPPLSSNKLIKIFGIAEVAAGKTLGRNLLTLGHKRVAFISDHSNDNWSVKRLQGLQEEYGRLGAGHSVVPFIMDNPQPLITALLTPRDITPDQLQRLGIEQTEGTDDPEALLDSRFTALRDIIAKNRDTIDRLRGYMRNVATIPQESMFGPTLERMMDHSVIYMGKRLEQMFLTILFDKAIAEGCTAWVGANDDIAIYAIHFLRSKNRRIPNDISVVGFDADPPGFEFQLTSFDFDFHNIIHQMISFVTHPGAVTRFTAKQHIQIPGMILWRGSLGKAK